MVTGLGGSPVPVIGMLLRVWLVVYGYGFPSFQTDPLFFFFTGAALPVVEKRNGLPCCRQLRPFITGIEGLRVEPCEPTLDPHFSLRATIFLTGISGFFTKISYSEGAIFVALSFLKYYREKDAICTTG